MAADGQSKFGWSVGAVVGAVVGVVAIGGGRDLTKRVFSHGEGDTPTMAELSQAASEVNKTLPIMVDKETELVSSAGLERTFVYNYRLVNVAKSDIDVPVLEKEIRPAIQNSACTTPATRDTFLKRGVTIRYTYADKSSVFVTQLEITPKDCGF